MAASNDRLVGVVSVNVQAATRKNLCEDVSGSSHALTGGSSYCYCESAVHMWGVCQRRWREPVLFCTKRGPYAEGTPALSTADVYSIAQLPLSLPDTVEPWWISIHKENSND